MKLKLFKFCAALSAAALFASCGGGSSGPAVERVISFGDSLSDVGTYANASAGRGKWTTNPGNIWVNTVAARYGYTINPAEVGFGAGPYTYCPAGTGCTGYAQGGSRITNPIGVSHFAADGVTPVLGTLPVKDQIDLHLAHSTFTDKDLVFVFVGPNDIFMQWGATFTGTTEAQASAALQQAGAETAAQVKRIKDAGAGYVYIMNSTNVGKIPYVKVLDPTGAGGVGALLTRLSQAFNQGLNDALATLKPDVKYIDIYTFTTEQDTNPAKYGLPTTLNMTDMACDPTKVPANLVFSNSSLYCNTNTLVAPGADMTYLWADIAHPTTIGHKAYSDYVIKQLAADGL